MCGHTVAGIVRAVGTESCVDNRNCTGSGSFLKISFVERWVRHSHTINASRSSAVEFPLPAR